MKHVIPAILLIAVAVCGCRSQFEGGSGYTYPDPDNKSTTLLMSQRDGDGQLFFVIAWIASQPGGSSARRDGLLTEIYDRPVHPRLDRRAVYALQPDGSLQEIPLTEEQIARIFLEMKSDDFHPLGNELWQREIAPKLRRVEESGAANESAASDRRPGGQSDGSDIYGDVRPRFESLISGLHEIFG
jgi:hypothetical protein